MSIRLIDRLIICAILFPVVASPVWYCVDHIDNHSLGAIIKIAYGFPLIQLVVAWCWAGCFDMYAQRYLVGKDKWPDGENAVYSETTYNEATEDFYREVLGTREIDPKAKPRGQGIVIANVRSEFDNSQSIGTAEAQFLPGLHLLYVLVREYFRRAGSRDEVEALNGYARRAAEWYRLRLSCSATPSSRTRRILGRVFRRILRACGKRNSLRSPDAFVFASAELYFSDIAEQIRLLLAETSAATLSENAKSRIPELLREHRVVPDRRSNHRSIFADIDFFDRQRRAHDIGNNVFSISPFWFKVSSLAPRLSILWLLAGCVCGSDGVSPFGLFRYYWRDSSSAAVQVCIGAGALLISTVFVGSGRFMLPEHHRWLRRWSRWMLVVGLGLGIWGVLQLGPSIASVRTDVSALTVPVLVALWMSLELLSLLRGFSFVGVTCLYHFGPTVFVGSFRTVALYLLQYFAFLAVGTLTILMVVDYFEGSLILQWPDGQLGRAALAYVSGGLSVLIALMLVNHAIFSILVGTVALLSSLQSWLVAALRSWRFWFVCITAALVAIPLCIPEMWTVVALCFITSLIPILALAWLLGSNRWRMFFRTVLPVVTVFLAIGSGVAMMIHFATDTSDVLVRSILAGLLFLRTIAWTASRFRRPNSTPSTTNQSAFVAVCLTGGEPVASEALRSSCEAATDRYVSAWKNVIVPNRFPSSRLLLNPDQSPLTEQDVRSALHLLFSQESERGTSIWGPEAIAVEGSTLTPMQESLQQRELLFIVTEVEADLLRVALRLRRYLATRLAPGRSQVDSVTFLLQLAHELRRRNLHDKVRYYLQSNRYRHGSAGGLDDTPLDDLLTYPGSRIELQQRAAVLEFVKATTEIEGEVTHVDTFDANKAAAQNGNLGTFQDAGWFLILDRNSQSFTLEDVANDIETIRRQPQLAVILPDRTASNVVFPAGEIANQSEIGASSFMRSLIHHWGGRQGEAVGFGWGSLVANSARALGPAYAHRDYPYRYCNHGLRTYLQKYFGGIRGFMNLPHISEDYAQAIISYESQKCLGRQPSMSVSSAIYHKLREHSQIPEFFAARPRWAGGGDPGQKGRDPLLQRICELGNDSVFVRELRHNRGSYYGLLPLALLSVLLLPLLVANGLTPFANVALLFIVGLVANQVHTISGLAALITHRGPLVGLLSWLWRRPRELMLFAPIMFIECCGVLVSAWKRRRFGFTFQASGQQNMEDCRRNLTDSISVPVLLMMVVGAFAIAANAWAVSDLDLENVVMLYPSILFALGLFIGCAIFQRLDGGRNRLLAWSAKVLGACLGLSVLTVASLTVVMYESRQWNAPYFGSFSRLQITLSFLALFLIWALPGRSAVSSRCDRLLLDRLPGLFWGAIAIFLFAWISRGAPMPIGTASPNLAIIIGSVSIIKFGCCWCPTLCRSRLWQWTQWMAIGAVSGMALYAEQYSQVGTLQAASIPLSISGAILAVGIVTRWFGEYFWQTMKRSSLLTIGAFAWFLPFSLPPVIRIQVFDLQWSLSPSAFREPVLIAVVVLFAVCAIAGIRWVTAWYGLCHRYRKLHRRLDESYRRFQVHCPKSHDGRPPTEFARVEAALAGFRFALDTGMVVFAKRLLTVARNDLEAVENMASAVPISSYNESPRSVASSGSILDGESV